MEIKHYRLAIKKISEAYALHKIIKNKSGKAVDFVFVEVNPAFRNLSKLNSSEIIGSKTSSIILEHKGSDSLLFYNKILENTNNNTFEIYSKTLKCWFDVKFEITNNDYLIVLIADITSHKLIDKYRESEIKYRQIFENANDAIFIMSGEQFVDCNDKTLEIFKCKRSDIIGKEPYKFSPPTQPDGRSSVDKVQEKMKAVQRGTPQRFEWIHTKLDGTPFYTEVSLSNFKRPKGETWVQAIVRDISEQKKAEKSLTESEARYKSLFDTMPTGFYRSTPEGYFVDANPAFINMLGYKNLDELKKVYIPTEIYVHTSEREEAISDNSAFINELEVYRLKRKDGNIIWIEDNARYIRDENGKVLFHEGICRDVTDRKSAEKERALKEKLEKKIILAEETLKFKQNFLANMSHEMRTPLTGIIGVAELLKKTKPDDTQANYINILLQSGDSLKEIINKVLDFSKIEAGQVRLEKRTFQIESLMDNAESLFNSLCKKPIKFEYNIDKNLPEYIKADQLRIIQIINNLVSNALKFTEKGKISISAELIQWSDDNKNFEMKVRVSDTGRGIPKNIQKKLFKPFSQIEAIDTRQFEGTGLGLSICKELAELHGGEIGVESKVNKGSSFWFTIMAQKAEKVTEEKKESRKIAKHVKLRILLTEDNKVNQKVIKLTLLSLGHEVSIANNGKEALKKFKSGKFDLILMDIQMPVMDGIMATNKLKNKHKDLPPVVGLSANAFEGDREKYMQKGLDEYLIKPLDLDSFNDVINKLF